MSHSEWFRFIIVCQGVARTLNVACVLSGGKCKKFGLVFIPMLHDKITLKWLQEYAAVKVSSFPQATNLCK